ncbi:MAG: hypothetical protein ACUVTW_00585 [Thermogutta sp.]
MKKRFRPSLPPCWRQLRAAFWTAAFLAVVPSPSAFSQTSAGIPPHWKAAWENPPLDCRPMQIVHGVAPGFARADGMEQILGENRDSATSRQDSEEGMEYFLRRGRGGIVCNVAADQYLESAEHWQTLVQAVDVCSKLGMQVWIYDEKGYPSAGAGGLVLRGHPEFEALVLAFSGTNLSDPTAFFLRPAYEHTHAANNYHAKRRYPNLLDDRATRRFIEVTHEAYYRRLEPHFGTTIRAFFTDEPSLMAVDLGPIPEPAGSKVPVDDPLDPNVPKLPTVPWAYDLADRYAERYHESLEARRPSLFAGDTEEDREARRRYWSLVGDLTAERYFGQIRDWTRAHRTASSGHNLHEESIIHHVPLYGNGLKAISMMDIPGLDMLTSDPQAVMHAGWQTAAMPLSGALLRGNRRVMTEVSDFAQKMSGAGPAPLEAMLATAAWQAAWGVTEFTLYYSPEDRSPEENLQYGLFVGRLNAVLRDALPVPQVGLYYPIRDLWSEYRPVAEPLRLVSQSERAQELAGSYYRLGQSLQRRQIPFVLVDHEFFAAGRVTAEGKLRLGGAELSALLLPSSAELPPDAAKVAADWRAAGGKVIQDTAAQPIGVNNVRDAVTPDIVVEPPEDALTLGRFTRDGREILLLVNVGSSEWTGHVRSPKLGTWQILNPHSATAEYREVGAEGLSLTLPPREARILVR